MRGMANYTPTVREKERERERSKVFFTAQRFWDDGNSSKKLKKSSADFFEVFLHISHTVLVLVLDNMMVTFFSEASRIIFMAARLVKRISVQVQLSPLTLNPLNHQRR